MQSSSIPLNHFFKFQPKPHLFPPELYKIQPRLNLFGPRLNLFGPRMANSPSGFKIKSISQMGSTESSVSDDGICTLLEYVGQKGANMSDDLVILFGHLEYASKRIASIVASPFNSSLANYSVDNVENSGRDKPKPLDIVAVCNSCISVDICI